MSEAKKKTVSELQQEYQALCTKAGHMGYQIDAMQKELDQVHAVLRSINLEASAIAAAEAPKAEVAEKAEVASE